MRSTDRTPGAYPPANYPDDARYWRQRAQESHSLAEQMNNVAARGIMLDIALRYEAMAKSTELRLDAAAAVAKKAD